MKRILNAINWGWSVYRRPQQFQSNMLKIMELQFNFLKETADFNSPRLTHLATIYYDTEERKEKQIRLLSLWCSVGEKNPIERIEELAKENQQLKNTIASILDKNES